MMIEIQVKEGFSITDNDSLELCFPILFPLALGGYLNLN